MSVNRIDVAAKRTGYVLAAYMSLHTGPPTYDNEIAMGGSYQRIRIVDGDFATNLISIVNARDLQFAQPQERWGRITHFAFWDSPSHWAGNRITYGSLTTPKDVRAGDCGPVFLAGGINLSVNVIFQN